MEAKKEVDEERQANLEIWQYALGFAPLAVVKCAIELQLADVLEAHGGSMTHAELSAAVGCSPPILRRIMRYLINRGFFKETPKNQESSISYTQTALSKLLIKNGENTMAATILLQSHPFLLAPWHNLSSRALINGAPPLEVEDEHGADEGWEAISANPAMKNLIEDAIGSVARQYVAAIVDHYPDTFREISSLVEVRGGNGDAVRAIVKLCPWIRGINFDFPNVVANAPNCDGVEHVAGNMFDEIPKSDAAFLMTVLHDYDDEECIRLLKKCRDAIPLDKGTVIIVDAVIHGEEDKYNDLRLASDMVMLAHTENGNERTYEQWEYVMKEAGFSKFTVKNIESIRCLIEAYP